jgi:hypothetical protein
VEPTSARPRPPPHSLAPEPNQRKARVAANAETDQDFSSQPCPTLQQFQTCYNNSERFVVTSHENQNFWKNMGNFWKNGGMAQAFV